MIGDLVNQTHLIHMNQRLKCLSLSTLESSLLPQVAGVGQDGAVDNLMPHLKVTALRPALIPIRPSIGCFVDHGRFAPARLRSTFPEMPAVATSRYHIHSIIQLASQHTAQVVTAQVVVIPLIAVEAKGRDYTPRHGIRRRPVPSNLCKTFTSSIFARQPQPVK